MPAEDIFALLLSQEYLTPKSSCSLRLVSYSVACFFGPATSALQPSKGGYLLKMITLGPGSSWDRWLHSFRGGGSGCHTVECLHFRPRGPKHGFLRIVS